MTTPNKQQFFLHLYLAYSTSYSMKIEKQIKYLPFIILNFFLNVITVSNMQILLFTFIKVINILFDIICG